MVPAGFLCASGTGCKALKSTESLQVGPGGLLPHACDVEDSPGSSSGLCSWKMRFCGHSCCGSPALQPLERSALRQVPLQHDQRES